ncbi:DNA-binding transcriptional activator of the SARP family [Lentzea albidocapillata subsp. violacea]|uniref:DNA-binding transcriptional activator of the SARP family n=1 Tax=Lentzea albidocapillata subsp. violacea TaxID=128104 RepID=A0A1G9LT41_9PSEU|nr:BTAD domain-containing putative transcriptional regulator [Lentzea albidocapillata]SDL65170.1 DNA-binding transcriptional activator of the SARP family [Lentzea albidocapillata subsp. violacea]
MLEISFLGPLRIHRDNVEITPSAPKLRQVLALLTLNANSLATVEQLGEELWGEELPASAATTLQTYIYQLRRRLGLVGAPISPGGGAALITRVGGYELQLDESQRYDVRDFEQLIATGRSELATGDFGGAVDRFSRALSVWRGDALMDVPTGKRLSAWCAQLEERRKRVHEQRFNAALELGGHYDVLDELTGMVRMHPVHEGFAGQLMLALYRCGRRGEALDVFRRTRGRLVEELGLEPGSDLQQLHAAVLSDARSLTVPHARRPSEATAALAQQRVWVTPGQLLPDVPDFVGRRKEVRQIVDHLGASRTAGTALPVIEIHGPAGIGKTALAMHASHRLRSHFPDGQLYVDLSAVGTGEDTLVGVLSSCLIACGARRADLPGGLDELSLLFRSWTADRRVLVVVDDVMTASQLTPLIPAGSGCALIACYRYRVHTLSVGEKLHLQPLGSDEALALFGGIAGQHRLEQEPEAVRDLVERCGRLPLPVRAAAAKLGSRPSWRVATLVDRLVNDEFMVLNLPGGIRSLRSTLETSCRGLSDANREVLQVVVGHGPVWADEDLAEIFGAPVNEVHSTLEQLADMHLLDEVVCDTGAAGYRVPSLIAVLLRSLLDRPRLPL